MNPLETPLPCVADGRLVGLAGGGERRGGARPAQDAAAALQVAARGARHVGAARQQWCYHHGIQAWMANQGWRRVFTGALPFPVTREQAGPVVRTLPLTTMCSIICLRVLRGAPRPVWTGPQNFKISPRQSVSRILSVLQRFQTCHHVQCLNQGLNTSLQRRWDKRNEPLDVC